MIDKIIKTDELILRQLLANPIDNSAYSLSQKLGLTHIYIHQRLRFLIDREIIKKSMTHRYFVPPGVVPVVLKHFREKGEKLDRIVKRAAAAEFDGWAERAAAAVSK